MTHTHPIPTTENGISIENGEHSLTLPEFALDQTIGGITIRDTPLLRKTTALIRDAEDDLLFDHSRRVFLFGALQGGRRRLQPDLELLYVGAMFHDIGLTARYRTSSLRFEVDGANAARNFLLDHGADEAAARKMWLSIALHTTPAVPEFLDPEIALVTGGVETDMLGIERDDVPSEVLAAVTAAHPRPDFKNGILQAFTNGMTHRPRSTFGTVIADVLGALRRFFRPRRFRGNDPQQHLARITLPTLAVGQVSVSAPYRITADTRIVGSFTERQ